MPPLHLISLASRDSRAPQSFHNFAEKPAYHGYQAISDWGRRNARHARSDAALTRLFGTRGMNSPMAQMQRNYSPIGLKRRAQMGDAV